MGFVERCTTLAEELLGNRDFIGTWCAWAYTGRRSAWGARALADFITRKAVEHVMLALVYGAVPPVPQAPELPDEPSE